MSEEDNTFLFNWCSQRKSQIQLTSRDIKTRVELQASPYNGNYTQEQLNMRRKIEILKYKSNKMSTQTNSLTRSERWSQIVNGSITKNTYSKSVLKKIKNNTLNCDITNPPPTPSTSCNIPGPLFYLINDFTVPLYNYKNSYTYSIESPAPSSPWKLYDNYNVTINNDIYSTISSIYFKNIDLGSVNCDISIPIGINIVIPFSPDNIQFPSIIDDPTSTIIFNLNNPPVSSTIIDKIKTYGLNININIITIKLSFFYNENPTEELEYNLGEIINFHVTDIKNGNGFTSTLFLKMVNINTSLNNVATGSVFNLKCKINYLINITIPVPGANININTINNCNLICNLTQNNNYFIYNGTTTFVDRSNLYRPFSINIS
jgi:hypothetical protein